MEESAQRSYEITWTGGLQEEAGQASVCSVLDKVNPESVRGLN